MQTSVYQKVNKDILLEWVYDDDNFIQESFHVLNNLKDKTLSYVGGDLTANTFNNQLFPVNIVTNTWAKINTSTYNFLKVDDYTMSSPVKHDRIKLHFPSGFNFGENQGVFIKVYTYDFRNKNLVSLCNFYFNRNDSNQSDLIDTVTPPFLYDGGLWDRIIEIDVPSVSFVAAQTTSGFATPGSINDYLTSGVGLSFTSPIFVDFSFITAIQTIGTQTNYILSNPFTIQIGQSPQLTELQLFIQESTIGDYFEIYPLYNNTFDNFVQFINQSQSLGYDYYTEYLITLFEENIPGRTLTYLIDSDFTELIEWRPILRSSTALATIEVEMRLINNVDGSIISRVASYGLASNQISKYSFNLKRIAIQTVQKPKIYVQKQSQIAPIDALTRKQQQQVTVNVEVPSLASANSMVAFSPNDLNPKSDQTMLNYHPFGQMKLLIQPFDNILKFSIASLSNGNLIFLDLTDSQNLTIAFKSDKAEYSFGIYPDNSDILATGATTSVNLNLKDGGCAFKVPQSAYQDLKNIYTDGTNLFYITTNNNNVETIIYSGLFIPSDSQDATQIFQSQNLINQQQSHSSIIDDPSQSLTAVVTRKLVSTNFSG